MATSYHIKNGWLVSVDDNIGTQPNCDVLVENGVITAVGKNIQAPDGVDVIDATDCIISPGFVDTHRHAWQSQLKNITSNDLLPAYFLSIRNVYGSCYTAHDAYLGNLMGALESIDAGVTFLIDHSHIMNSPDHADAAVKGLQDAGVRGVFCYGLYQNQEWNGVAHGTIKPATQPDWRLEDAKRIKEKYFKLNGPDQVLRFGFAPAEVERYPVDVSISEIQYGRNIGAALITGHISLGKLDRGVNFIRKMKEQNLLGQDLLFSHCASLATDELEACRQHGVSISCTPETEMQMAMGPPIAFKSSSSEHRCKTGLGIDVACNNPIDMFQQMRLMLQGQRNVDNLAGDEAPKQISRTCDDILRLATMGGAEAVGMESSIGSITPGKRADLVITRCTSMRLTPVHDPVAALVLYANASDVDTVLVNGVILKKDGKVTAVNWNEIRPQFVDSVKNIMDRAKVAPMDDIKKRILEERSAHLKQNKT